MALSEAGGGRTSPARARRERRDSRRPPTGAPDVVVLRALGLGDFLTAIPALRALRRGLPSHRIILAAPEPLWPLAALANAVHSLLPTRGLDQIAWSGRSPAIAVNLHGRGPQSHRVLLRLGAERILAYAHREVPGIEGPDWDQGEHEVIRWCRLVRAYGLDADPADLALQVPTAPNPAADAVVIHPGAGDPARRWPVERFAAVAGAMRTAGSRVVVTGSAAERGLAKQVAGLAGLPPDSVLAGRTNAAELATLVAGARVVVCGDTGLGHLATAYQTPSVLLFGPTPPALWGPRAAVPRHVVLWKGPNGLPSIGVADVLAAIDRALDQSVGACR